VRVLSRGSTISSALVLTLLEWVTPGSPALLAQQVWPGLQPGPYAVGYRVEHEYDYSRSFRQEYDYFGEPLGGEIARPIQISIWYPAADPRGGEAIELRAYYDATATETDFAPPDQETLDAALARFERILTMEWGVAEEDRPGVLARVDSVLSQEAFARAGAPPADGPFPLVLHLPGYNASPLHHYPLFEFLASHGYVVMAVPNMGAHSRTIDNEGMSMDVQARDLEFAYSYARSFPFVDTRRVATTGMSWGGMSNVLFASRNSYVDVAVTFDGAITMPAELDLLERVPGFELGSLRAAYLQFLVSPDQAVFRPKDLRFWDALRYSDALMLQFNGVAHDCFAPGNLRLRLLTEPSPERVAYLEDLSRTLERYTLAFLDAHLKGDLAAAEFLSSSPEVNGVPAGMVALSASKNAVRPPPTEEEFRAILVSRGPDVAEEVYRAVRESDPERQLITSSLMGPLYMEAFQSGDLDLALAICRLWALGMPEDVGPLFSIARVHRARGAIEEAIEAYRKILEVAPDHPAAANARAAIEELGGIRRDMMPNDMRRR
jgi:dienelactone hydrolase